MPPQHAACLLRSHSDSAEHAEVVPSPAGDRRQGVHQNKQREEGGKGFDNLQNASDTPRMLRIELV